MNVVEHLHPGESQPTLESKLRRRLEELRAEYDKGQQTLHELETQAANVRATLLRISGAIQVLQEALGESIGQALSPGQAGAAPRLPLG